MWKYGAGQGKFGDAAAYYSSLGFVMDAAALVLLLLFAWRTLSRDWFETVVRPVDGTWDWIQVKLVAAPSPRRSGSWPASRRRGCQRASRTRCPRSPA